MKVISVFNQKGGTGKTSICVSLGTWLHKQGYRVAFVDLDEQGNLTTFFNFEENYLGSYDLLLKRHSFDELKVDSQYGSVIVGNNELSIINAPLEALKQALEPVKKAYDYVLVDLHPGLSSISITSIYASNVVLVPINADLFSEYSITALADTVKSTNSKAKVYTFFNNTNPRTNLFKCMKERVQQSCKKEKVTLLETVIRPCTALPESIYKAKPIFDYAPKSNASKDMEALFKELLSVL